MPPKTDDQDRHQRHVADHPAPDQLEPPDRLGDDRVDRLLLDVRGQAERGQDRDHDGQEQRAEQGQRADEEPAHLGRSRRLEEPVGERQDQAEDGEDHPGGPHPAVGLVDAQPGDRVEPARRGPRTARGRTASKIRRQHDVAHVSRAEPGAVDRARRARS